MFVRHEKRVELFPLGMGIDPIAHFDYLAQVFLAEVTQPHAVHRLLVFFLANCRLPVLRKHQMYIVVEIASFENIPLVLVEPNSGAMSAAINRKIDALTNSVLYK